MAVVNFVTAVVTAIYFLTRETVDKSMCSEGNMDGYENGKFTNSIQEFGVFAVEVEARKNLQNGNGVVVVANGEKKH